MGGMLTPSKESEIIKMIRLDNPKKLQEFLISNNIDSNSLYTNRKRTLIQLCCYYTSPRCLSKLIELKYDYNKKEISTDYTPLYIACKFNCLKIVEMLLSQKDINVLQANVDNFNEFEISFLRGNYEICYYLLFEYKKNENKNNIDNDKDQEINTKMNMNIYNDENIVINQNNPYQKFFYTPNFNLEKYMTLQNSNQYPLFNMKLFYESLYNKVSPEECSSFAAERKKTKDLLTKVPDPNETWGHFFKRLANMELYNPPLVDKRNVSQMNSLYMNTQMKLLENEYGIKMKYYNPEETKYVLDDEQEEEKPIIRVENTEKKLLKDESQSLSLKNNLKDNNSENNNILNVNINKTRNRERERKIEAGKISSNDNMCVININNKSSDRPIKSNKENDEINEEDEK